MKVATRINSSQNTKY